VKGASDGVTAGAGLAVRSASNLATGNVVHANTVKGYQQGIEITGTVVRASSNKAQDGGIGFVVDTEDSVIVDNRAVGNGTGFDVIGNGNAFGANAAKRQTGNGFDVTGSSNTFVGDRAIKNGDVGFVIADTAPGEGNTLSETRAKRNADCQYQIGDNNVDGGGNRANGKSISFGADGGDFCP